MLDLESLNNNMCQNTPTQSCSSNYNYSPPSAPRRKYRVSLDITTRVLDNLESLSAPPLASDSPATDYNFSSFYNPQNPLFKKSLLQMCQGGDALQKLRDQRDAALAKEREQEEAQEKATARLRALSVQDSKSEKCSPSSPKVKLVGQHAPKRANGSTALSA
jgi:hypothetical protein